jgi:hypothetical protein
MKEDEEFLVRSSEGEETRAMAPDGSDLPERFGAAVPAFRRVSEHAVGALAIAGEL